MYRDTGREKKSGSLQLMPGDKFRLTIGSTEWISDGHTYWQYNEKTSQVIIKNLLDVDLSMHPSQMIKTYLGYAYQVKSDDAKARGPRTECETFFPARTKTTR